MKEIYEAWIEGFLRTHNGNVKDKCIEASTAMAAFFSGLKQVRGFVITSPEGVENLPTVKMALENRRLVWDQRLGYDQHAWCVTAANEIVDPTYSQYKHWPAVIYIPYDESKHGPKPAGKCMDCGDLLFPPETQKDFCDDACRKKTEDYLAEEQQKWMGKQA